MLHAGATPGAPWGAAGAAGALGAPPPGRGPARAALQPRTILQPAPSPPPPEQGGEGLTLIMMESSEEEQAADGGEGGTTASPPSAPSAPGGRKTVTFAERDSFHEMEPSPYRALAKAMRNGLVRAVHQCLWCCRCRCRRRRRRCPLSFLMPPPLPPLSLAGSDGVVVWEASICPPPPRALCPLGGIPVPAGRGALCLSGSWGCVYSALSVRACRWQAPRLAITIPGAQLSLGAPSVCWLLGRRA
jgi:hypothetical protein